MNPRVIFRSCFVDFFWVNRGCERFRIHASCLECFSMMISQSAPTLFSFTFSKSIRVSSASESRRLLWKLFRWRLPSRHQFRFRWLFLTQQGMAVIPNPRITFEKCFGDDFPADTDSVFIDFFLINKCWQLFWIHTSSLKSVSVITSQSAPTLFSFTFSESTRAGSYFETTRPLWKVFRWWFRSQQRCNFCWLFLSQQGLWVLPNPRVTCGSCLVDFF